MPAMSLPIGTRLGPYEVLAPLGAGGMGEVYQARDTRLGRLVALKVLGRDTASDPAARSRFDREGRAIAGLTHPRVCTLYDVGYEEGTPYLVMEYVEGDTLSALIRRGPLTVAAALDYANQIAEALDFAHRHGFVHRDLKPGNVMVASSGVKLLDFGLAKLCRADASPEDELTAEVTAPGTLIGTVTYMSPEQLDGQQVDARADIWAFGAVLFEMLTGERAFAGDRYAAVIASILEREPPSVAARRPDTPVLVGHVIRRCLVRNRDARWQSIADVRATLAWATDAGDAPRVAPAPRADPRRKRATQAIWALTAMAAMLLTFLLGRSLRPPAAVPATTHEEHADLIVAATTDPFSLALSPDGRQLVYAATGDGVSRFYLRALDTGQVRPLNGTERGSSPFWAPNGRSIAFFADGQLERLDFDSGGVRALAQAAAWRGGSWGEGGEILFAPDSMGPLSRVSAAGGEPQLATRLDRSFTSHRSPHFLPDGRHFLFLGLSDDSALWAYVAGPDLEPKRLFKADTDVVPIDSSHVLVVQEGTLYVRAFDPERFEIRGEPVLIAQSVAYDRGLAAVTASSTGAIAYRTGGPRKRQLEWFDRSGRFLGPLGAPDPSWMLNPDLSIGDRTVVVQRSTATGWDLWTIDTARGALMRLTSDPASEWCPVWSHDGSRVAFASDRGGQFDLYEKAVAGSAAETPLFASPLWKIPVDWSRDDRFLLFRSLDSRTGSDLWALPLEGDRTPIAVATTAFEEREGQFSPDGRWVAYQSNESGRFEIYVQAFPGGGGKTRVSLDGGAQVRWNANGHELFYIGLDDHLMAVPFVGRADGRAVTVGQATSLFASHILLGAIPGANRQQYVVSESGQRFLISVTPNERTDSPIGLILHWAPPTATVR
jgi:Tol biopolymer transport system component